MIYVAAPYSSHLPELITERFVRTQLFTDKLLAQGFHAYSPVCYCHGVAQRMNLQTGAATWHSFNMDMLRRAEALYLLQLNGWEQSKGVKIELTACKLLSIPVANYSQSFRLLDEHWKGHLVEQF